MFLYHLPENLVESFLNLAYTLIAADRKITEQEKANFELYAVELNLSSMPECRVVNYDKELKYFLYLPKSIKKEIYFELVALAFSDSEYEYSERTLIKKVQYQFEIADSDAAQIENVVKNIIEQYKRLGEIINDEIHL